MRTYRISKTKYINDLSGFGAGKYPGRWNMGEIPVLYTAESRALALLEVLVNLPARLVKEPYSLASIEFSDDFEISEVLLIYPEFSDYHFLENNYALAQAVGARWAMEAFSPVLKVPSIIVPGEFNFIINPSHPQFVSVNQVEMIEFKFDRRLIWNLNEPG
jgi:RES domain-containing protein